ncbi:unnamed protein product [Anisakis simplex]|uniref:Dus domain-containing protein n=1 Tax=Anisakis simplex TaxID=6269 RepID=A0A0M3KF64_ANISI|nr:unnamed protein product [Anisakis simplex]
MIYAKDFIASQMCRSSEFTTCEGDSPLIVQFASNDPVEFATATEFIYKFSSGVDLNCGCPKRDVVRDGYGSGMLKSPDRIADIVANLRRRITSDSSFTISIKIRVFNDIRRTVSLCRQVQQAGVSYISVHGRTPDQRGESPNYDAIKLVKSSLSIPVIANGAVHSYEQALQLVKRTHVDGVMAANGLLDNPAMFAGHPSTPLQCIADWVSFYATVCVLVND